MHNFEKWPLEFRGTVWLTPLASVNCKGRAFRGGYFVAAWAAAALCSTIHCTAHWSWLIAYAAGLFSVTMHTIVTAVILFCRNPAVLFLVCRHSYCSVTTVDAACICFSCCRLQPLSLLSIEFESLSVSELFKIVSTSFLVYDRFLLAMIDYARLQTIYYTQNTPNARIIPNSGWDATNSSHRSEPLTSFATSPDIENRTLAPNQYPTNPVMTAVITAAPVIVIRRIRTAAKGGR